MLNQLFSTELKFERSDHTSVNANIAFMWSFTYYNRDTIRAYCCILEKISPSELVSNGYISNHNKMRRPRPKFKVSFYLYFCCFWINVTQINFENIKRKMQRIISDSCFQLKSWFNVDARAPSIPLLNFPFNLVIIFFKFVLMLSLMCAYSSMTSWIPLIFTQNVPKKCMHRPV